MFFFSGSILLTQWIVPFVSTSLSTNEGDSKKRKDGFEDEEGDFAD